MSAPEKFSDALLFLADWVDAVDKLIGKSGTQVQDDLRLLSFLIVGNPEVPVEALWRAVRVVSSAKEGH